MDPFLGEVRAFPFSVIPNGWAACNGQLMPIAQNTALFALLGTMYGGDGKTTFGLPDLQGSVVIGFGQGPGLTDYDEGNMVGSEMVTLYTNEIPLHNHQPAGAISPSGAGMHSTPAQGDQLSRYTVSNAPAQGWSNTGSPQAQLAPQMILPAGGGLPHQNMQPYLTLQYCIALRGIFPPRPS
jgi:microcystin-dependent protein